MEVFKIFGTLGLRDNEYRSGLNKAEQQGKRVSTSINTGFKSTGSMFTGMGIAAAGFGASMLGMAGVATGLAAGMAGVVSTGATYERTMSEVKAVSGANAEQMGELGKEARRLGASTSFSAKEAGEGMKFLAMSGMSTNDVLKSTEPMLRLAEAGALDLGQAADIATNIMSSFGLKANSAGHTADVLAAAASKSNTNVQQMGEAMKYGAGAASTLGFDMEETAAAIMSMANRGLQGSIAGQAFATSLTRLAKPTKEMQKTMDGLGLSFFDSQGKIKPMVDIVKMLEERTAGMSEQQKSATLSTLFGAEAFKNWAAVLGEGSEKLQQNEQMLRNSNGAATEMSNTMNDNLIGAWKNFTSAVSEVALQIYDVLGPALTGAVKWMTDLVTAFSTGGSNVGIFQSAFSALAEYFTPAMEGMRGVSESFASAFSATGAMVVSIAGEVWNFIKGVFDIMKPYIMGAINEISSFTSSILNQIAGFWRENGAQISQAVSVAFSFIQSVISAVMPIVSFIISSTWDAIKSVISGALNIIMGVIKVFSSVLTGDWTGLWEGIKQILSGAWDLLVGLVELGVGKITGLVTKFVPGLGKIFAPVTDLISKPFDMAWKAVEKVVGYITKAWDGISGILGKVKEGASSVGSFVGGIVSGPARAAAAPVNGFASGGIFKPNQERMIKIGDAKSYDEAVLPLNQGTLGKIGDRIAATMQPQYAQQPQEINLTSDINIDGKRLARAMARYISEELGALRKREVRA